MWRFPAWDATDTADYGQLAARAETRAAGAVATALGIRHAELTADCKVGAGDMADHCTHPVVGSPSPEWWPFRNQLLVTLVAG
jgi:7-cyano-7-deazaguanine synthase